MKTRFWWLIVLGLMLLIFTNGYACQSVKPDYRRNYSEIDEITKNYPGLITVEGEIVGINHQEILVSPLPYGNSIYRLKLISDTKLFCNGAVSQWEALKPVAPGAYFEAEVLTNGQTAIAVNAFYYGDECVIKRCYRNQDQLVLELYSVLSDRLSIYPVNRAARLPSGKNWLQEGQVIYILLGERGEIRAVYLPD